MQPAVRLPLIVKNQELIEAEITLLTERREKMIAESAELKKAGALLLSRKHNWKRN